MLKAENMGRYKNPSDSDECQIVIARQLDHDISKMESLGVFSVWSARHQPKVVQGSTASDLATGVLVPRAQ